MITEAVCFEAHPGEFGLWRQISQYALGSTLRRVDHEKAPLILLTGLEAHVSLTWRVFCMLEIQGETWTTVVFCW